jgi:tetratricopeptide (TPR) repeat protein
MCTQRPRFVMAARILPPLMLVGLLVGCGRMSGYAMNRSGMGYYKAGNYTAARGEFTRAVADNPGNADYRYNLATAMKKQGDAQTAEQVYRQAINTNPNHQPSHHGLAMMLHEQGRTAEATGVMTAWAGTQPWNPKAHVELASLQRKTGDYAGAEQSLQTALNLQPRNPTTLAHLGQLYQDTGRGDMASAMYQRSLANNYYQPEVQSRLASISGQSAVSRQQGTHFAALPSTYSPNQTMTAGMYGGGVPTMTAGVYGGTPIQFAAAVPSAPTSVGATPTPADADPAHADDLENLPTAPTAK